MSVDSSIGPLTHANYMRGLQWAPFLEWQQLIEQYGKFHYTRNQKEFKGPQSYSHPTCMRKTPELIGIRGSSTALIGLELISTFHSLANLPQCYTNDATPELVCCSYRLAVEYTNCLARVHTRCDFHCPCNIDRPCDIDLEILDRGSQKEKVLLLKI